MSGKPSQADALVALADEAELFSAADGDTAFATVEVSGHRETWPIRSRGFKRWLIGRFYKLQKKAPGSQALADAVNVIEAWAHHEGPLHPVHIRVAPGPAESIFVDLADEDWTAVEISAGGWSRRPDPPVKFRRARGMLPLPCPVQGGSLEHLRAFLNLRGDDQWALAVGWLIAAMRPAGPYPVLALLGEQGAAKSTTARVLRRLLDPNAAELRAEPTDPRDVMIAATNGWVINLDNVSRIPAWLSDCLCRLATGGGFATRELYSDAEETIFDAQRPVILNGIEEMVTRGDLLDRAILLDLPNICDGARRPEAEFWAAFDTVRPRLLGALFDVVAVALKRIPAVHLDRLPRMADFAAWGTAAAPALGWSDKHFISIYGGNRAAAHEVAVDASPVGPLIVALAEEEWTGTASELLAALAQRADGKVDKTWPATPKALAGILRRLAPPLRALGVDMVFSRELTARRRRLIALKNREAVDRPDGPDRPADGPVDAGPAFASKRNLASDSDLDGVDDVDGEIPVRSSLDGVDARPAVVDARQDRVERL